MFTGLVRHVGRVVSMESVGGGGVARLLVDAAGWGYEAERGDSIAVAGVCLTSVPHPVSEEAGREGGKDRVGLLAFDVVAETLGCTTLGGLVAGDRVNLESCLTPSTPVGGHFVQGHVDGVGKVARVQAGAAGDYRLVVRLEPDLMPYLTPKGSVAVDGVSLTIAALGEREPTFAVALIPETLEATTLGELMPGAAVNVECDTLAKTVVHYLRKWGGRSEDFYRWEDGNTHR